MKNYLVKTLFEVTSNNWSSLNKTHETENIYANYVDMHTLSVSSFKKYLQGDWELKFIGGKVNSIQDAFKRTWCEIYDLWHNEECNILYTDPDTLAIKNINIWDKFNCFMIFNFTDPKSLMTEKIKIPYFFNIGVRFFPKTMNKQVWEFGKQLLNEWDDDVYDSEQVILNKMFWAQGLKLEQALYPNLAYQAHWLPTLPLWQQDVWNGISINEAALIHFHGSRNSTEKLRLMRNIYEKI